MYFTLLTNPTSPSSQAIIFCLPGLHARTSAKVYKYSDGGRNSIFTAVVPSPRRPARRKQFTYLDEVLVKCIANGIFALNRKIKMCFRLKILSIVYIFIYLLTWKNVYGNLEANRLFEDLLSGYNKLIRPVTDGDKAIPLVVKFKMRLSQLLDVVRFSIFYKYFIKNFSTKKIKSSRQMCGWNMYALCN
jgi:hypothetical protein